MPKLEITNCHVNISGTEAALGCDHAGARYHVWLDVDRTVRQPLYKNPPASVTPGSHAYYSTRKLSTISRFGAALVTEMLAQMQRDSLYEKALEAHQRTVQEVARTHRLNAPVHLIVGTDGHGYLHFLTKDQRLSRDIRAAVAFSNTERDQADSITAKSHCEDHLITTHLTLLTLTTGQLATLTGEDLDHPS